MEVAPAASAMLDVLNNKLQSMQEERQETIDTYADSLRRHNKALNRKLRTLIATMDDQTERILTEKEQHLEASYNRSVRIITWLIGPGSDVPVFRLAAYPGGDGGVPAVYGDAAHDRSCSVSLYLAAVDIE